MDYKQVTWVERDDANPARRISALGGRDFRHSAVEAIMNIHFERCGYWMMHAGAPVWIVLDTRPGIIYLRTQTDEAEPEILLSLARPPLRQMR
ncbi:hypothetical protein [Hyphomonas pacifica]|uniref:hypothetical protein n=1 Tax=Hyphomonas pacifica TaxID=1280941 RepID=UPI000DBF4F1B|nr:hypothetical protein [Hyphomonas pacifica]RAN32764.1 hypothetical protein HY11_17330 [Hyphomonas pacifica]